MLRRVCLWDVNAVAGGSAVVGAVGIRNAIVVIERGGRSVHAEAGAHTAVIGGR